MDLKKKCSILIRRYMFMVRFYFLTEDMCFKEFFDIVFDIDDPKLVRLAKDAWFAYCRYCRSCDRPFSLTDTKYSRDFISNCVALFNDV